MDPRDGARYIVCELVLPYLRESYEDTEAIARGADLLITHPVTLAAFLLACKSNIPWASLALAPISMLSVQDMCVFPGLPFRRGIASLGPNFQRVFLKVLELVFERHWKPFRLAERELKLPRLRNPFLFGHSPQLALGLFSPLLAAPQPDWPPNAYATGFPFLDDHQGLSCELEDFLDSGDPPIVFTLGSAAVGVAGDYFEESVEASRGLAAELFSWLVKIPPTDPKVTRVLT